MSLPNPYEEAEAGWEALIEAAARIQAAANRIKDGPHSVDGYEIERALQQAQARADEGAHGGAQAAPEREPALTLLPKLG